jgi:hypothetical protein
MSAITDSESNYDLCRIRFSNRNVLPQKKSFRKKSLGDLNLIEKQQQGDMQQGVFGGGALRHGTSAPPPQR